MDRNHRLKSLAYEHGFALCGLVAVPLDGLAPGSSFFSDWLARGLHGPLGYLAQGAARRTGLRERFPWAKSMLCVGAFHGGAQGDSHGHALQAHVARYARGRDYHLVFEKRLKTLARALIQARLCGRAHWYVDTGPVLERAWAAAAGLGWIGKNACLVHPQHGSFFLIGEIILDLETDGDEALPDHCGSCRRCLDACPTQALIAPRLLDASRCLTTWNLELKGVSSPAGADALHGWVAGCDLCQDVCPFNAPSRTPEGDPELATPRDWNNLTLAQTIALSRKEYDRLFRASPLRRLGWRGLRLNAIRVAARTPDKAVRGALQDCLGDEDALVREVAQEALALLGA